MAARARENARADGGIVHWVFISACLGLDDPHFTSSTSMTKILSISQELGCRRGSPGSHEFESRRLFPRFGASEFRCRDFLNQRFFFFLRAFGPLTRFSFVCAFGPFTLFARRSLFHTGRVPPDTVSSVAENPPDRASPTFTLAFIFMFSPTRFERRLMSFPKSSEMRDMSTPRSLARRAISSPRS